jgi:phosphoribosylanthranilate isomerase
MTLVKVCGLAHRGDAELALELGAAALGFIFAPSPRRIAPSSARSILCRLPETAMEIGAVGVFVGAHRSAEWTEARPFLSAIQAHGDEPPEFLAGIADRIRIKVIRVAAAEDLGEMERYAPVADYFLLDAKVRGVAGGTGRAFDWGLLEGRSFPRPIFLAGGLTPDNVGEAIRRVRPFGVDAASGTEASPGRKDPAKLRDFFAAVHEADT